VDAHSQHSYRKHWAQTVLGLLACRNGDVDRAVSHLRESAKVRPEYRLSSYGPPWILCVKCARVADGMKDSSTCGSGKTPGTIHACGSGLRQSTSIESQNRKTLFSVLATRAVTSTATSGRVSEFPHARGLDFLVRFAL
jgi:hypothetical protein